ncbi:MAG: hypothetical protein JWO45_1273, partial [Spartobacteria bacterium]|nr:hypothetical protein [Spartobacteria bacterium]
MRVDPSRSVAAQRATSTNPRRADSHNYPRAKKSDNCLRTASNDNRSIDRH